MKRDYRPSARQGWEEAELTWSTCSHSGMFTVPRGNQNLKKSREEMKWEEGEQTWSTCDRQCGQEKDRSKKEQRKVKKFHLRPSMWPSSLLTKSFPSSIWKKKNSSLSSLNRTFSSYNSLFLATDCSYMSDYCWHPYTKETSSKLKYRTTAAALSLLSWEQTSALFETETVLPR